MENKNNKEHPKECACVSCEVQGAFREGRCGYGGRHHMGMRLIVKILVLVIVFCFGYQLGEIKGTLRSTYGFGYHNAMMGGCYDKNDAGYGRLHRMMWELDDREEKGSTATSGNSATQ